MTVHERTLRVAVLARSVYPLHRYGGLERHVYDLVRSLLARGVRITLVTPPSAAGRPNDPVADAALSHPHLSIVPVPYITFPFANRRGTTILDRSTAYPLFGWRAGRTAAELVASGEIDIVHGLGASAMGYALSNARMATAPLVFNPQGLEEFGATDPSRAPLKRMAYYPLRRSVFLTARGADRVIATDRSLMPVVTQHLRVNADRVRVIPNAIELADCDRFDSSSLAAQLRSRIGMAATDPLLVSVGRLERNKGFGVMIRALAGLARANALPDRWRWVIVGAGPLQDELRREVSSSGLTDRVVFAGRVEDSELHGWYEAATLFVHPTLYEGSSLVTLEAMAHRRAIVASRAGGLPDKVFPGVNGWLVEPGDADALAAAIRDALSEPHRLETYGHQSRAIVEREFSWKTVTDRLLELYGELLK